MPEESAPVDAKEDKAIVAVEPALSVGNDDEDLHAAVEFLKRNPSVPVAILALVVSVLAFIQSHRSADIAEGQLKLASRPLLYGTCAFTRSDFLKLSSIPDALMIAQPNAPTPPLQVQTLTKPLPMVPPYELALPWIVNRCSITNTGRGTAQGIQFEMKTMFVNTKTETLTRGKVSQTLTIDFLAPGASYDFIVGNRRDDTALILMPQTVTYQVGLTGESLTEPLVHSTFWSQLTLDNREKPKGLKPGE